MIFRIFVQFIIIMSLCLCSNVSFPQVYVFPCVTLGYLRVYLIEYTTGYRIQRCIGEMGSPAMQESLSHAQNGHISQLGNRQRPIQPTQQRKAASHTQSGKWLRESHPQSQNCPPRSPTPTPRIQTTLHHCKAGSPKEASAPEQARRPHCTARADKQKQNATK